MGPLSLESFQNLGDNHHYLVCRSRGAVDFGCAVGRTAYANDERSTCGFEMVIGVSGVERPAPGTLLGAVAGGAGADAVELGVWVRAEHLGACGPWRAAGERFGRQRGVRPVCWIAAREQKFVADAGAALLSGLPSRSPRPERHAAVLRSLAAVRSGRSALETFGASEERAGAHSSCER